VQQEIVEVDPLGPVGRSRGPNGVSGDRLLLGRVTVERRSVMLVFGAVVLSTDVADQRGVDVADRVVLFGLGDHPSGG
jgi:hypothetical protein